MSHKNNATINTIFVDCFSTIIFRKIKTSEVFKLWAKHLSKKYNINWKDIYKTYTKTNFSMCVRKIFTSFTLQEEFSKVLKKVYDKLQKKYANLPSDFVAEATEIYIATELENFVVNNEMIDFLKAEKQSGKSIYLVSDFYCKSDILKRWLAALNVIELFNEVFSSGDFDKEKATTKLYRYLIKELATIPQSTIMYGDNLWSDILMAKACKLNAKRIKQTLQRINNDERK
jgi:FMN phosphatase YigB (HAD superfamily)